MRITRGTPDAECVFPGQVEVFEEHTKRAAAYG